MNASVMMIVALAVILYCVVGCASSPQRSVTIPGLHPQSFQDDANKDLHAGYLLYLPPQYAASQQDWPLILFLHGAGERGDDLERLKVHGPAKLITRGEQFPFVIVAPQCPEEDWWANELQTDTLDALLADIVSCYRIDENRVYLSGLSMGGQGTWRLALDYPRRFAAIAPICGRSYPDEAGKIADLPIWVFHGAQDNTVPVGESDQMVAALREAGSAVKYTVYPDAGHDSWSETYDNPELYEWFLQHTR